MDESTQLIKETLPNQGFRVVIAIAVVGILLVLAFAAAIHFMSPLQFQESQSCAASCGQGALYQRIPVFPWCSRCS